MYPQQMMYPVSSGTGPLYPVPVGMSPAGPVYSTGHTPVQYSTGQTSVQYMYQQGNQNTLYEPNPTQRNTMVRSSIDHRKMKGKILRCICTVYTINHFNRISEPKLNTGYRYENQFWNPGFHEWG